MQAVWNTEKRQYDISFSEKELGMLIFGLTVAKYETKDDGVACLQKDLLNLNNATAE